MPVHRLLRLSLQEVELLLAAQKLYNISGAGISQLARAAWLLSNHLQKQLSVVPVYLSIAIVIAFQNDLGLGAGDGGIALAVAGVCVTDCQVAAPSRLTYTTLGVAA